MAQQLICPCGSTNLWSEEVASIMYTVILTRNNDGELNVEYDGNGYDAMDEGTTYDGTIWCRDCCNKLTEDDLLTEDEQVKLADAMDEYAANTTPAGTWITEEEF